MKEVKLCYLDINSEVHVKVNDVSPEVGGCVVAIQLC